MTAKFIFLSCGCCFFLQITLVFVMFTAKINYDDHVFRRMQEAERLFAQAAFLWLRKNLPSNCMMKTYNPRQKTTKLAKFSATKGSPGHFSRCLKCFSLLQREKWRSHPLIAVSCYNQSQRTAILAKKFATYCSFLQFCQSNWYRFWLHKKSAI